MLNNIELSVFLAPYCASTYFRTSNVNVSSMTIDSRVVNKGTLFVAVQGATFDGRKFIKQAISSGATAVLSETKNKDNHGKHSLQNGIIVVELYNLQEILSDIAYRFYFSKQTLHPVIAVTGTNGKTTIASLLANSLMLLDKKSAQMGTIGNGLYGELSESLNTTLDAISVFSELNKYQQQKCEYTIMEVSSHGLIQNRVKALPFYSAIFTNLTRDHLDYHGTMKSYENAKKTLFQAYPLTHRIINADDEIGMAWLNEFPDAISYGKKRNLSADTLSTSKQRYLQINNVSYHPTGIEFSFVSSWGEGQISAPFYGDFNVSNLAAVLTQLLVEGIEIKACEKIFNKLDMVAGRMEQYHFPEKGITFVVDYAHTPDALEKALQALQCHNEKGRLICVFGCGGDRDKGKRPEMAAIAEKHANKVMLVDDNPRTESASDIMKDILAGFKTPECVDQIHQRENAVLHLIENAQQGDIVLLAGKGHEDYQIIGTEKIHYSDRELLTQLQHKKHSSQIVNGDENL